MGLKNLTRYVSFRGRVWRQPGDLPIFYGFFGSVVPLGYDRHIGANVPQRRKLIRAGVSASGSLAVKVSTAEATDLSTELTYRKSANPDSKDYNVVGGSMGADGVILGCNHPISMSSHVGSSSMAAARAIAIRQLQKTFTARRRQFQGGVFAGELMKTIGMVAKPAKSMQQKARRFSSRLRQLRKRGYLRSKGENFAKVVADSWLELTFGWKPLLSDVRDGALALARVATRDALQRQQFRAYGEDIVPVTTANITTFCSLDPFNTLVYTGTRLVSNTSVCILYGAWSTRLASPETLGQQASRLAELSGLNWEDVPAQVWELVPWSFLVDYFINVGDVIEAAANTFNGPAWVTEVNTVISKQEDSIHLDIPAMKTALGGLYLTSSDIGSNVQSSYRTVSRGAYAGSLQPELAFRLPVDMQWLNIAALVAGGKPLQPFLK